MISRAHIATKLRRPLRRFASRSDAYRVDVVSTPAERFDPDRMPFELQFIFSELPESREKVHALLERGYGIGIRTTPRAPGAVLASVARISEHTQRGVVEPWLSRLIFQEEIPLFTEDELVEHGEQGINLYTEAHIILSERFTMKRIVLVDLHAHGLEDADMEFVSRMNRALEPLSAAYLHHRIHMDRKTVSFRPLAVLAKALLIIGPLAHLLERWVRGIGQLFAALADDVSREIGESFTLKSSGYTPRQLWRRIRIYLPLLVIDIYAALQVFPLANRGALFAAGCLFGFVAVSFPLLQLVQRFVSFRASFGVLERDGKLPTEHRLPLSAMAVREITRSPMHAGLGLGVILSPLGAGLVFLLLPSLIQNGWLLALLASLEIGIAFFYAGNMMALDRVLFIRKIRKRISAV